MSKHAPTSHPAEPPIESTRHEAGALPERALPERAVAGATLVAPVADRATERLQDWDVDGPDTPSVDDMDAPPSAHHIELPELRFLPSGRPADLARPLSEEIAEALFGPPLDETLAAHPELERALVRRAARLAARAYPADRVTSRASDRWIDHEARSEHHRALLAVYQQHVRLPHLGTAANQFHPLACRLMAILEGAWERDMLARARRAVPLGEHDLPADPDAFVEWYKHTAFAHPLYEHDLYSFVAVDADRRQIEWFLRLEAAGEAAFDDLVALGQVGTRGEVKIEMATNYWDEMGNGRSHAVHTHLFHRLTEGLQLTAPDAAELPWQVLAGVNVMLWSCIPRRNAFRAQGTLGAVELLAPQRCTRLVHGALRVGISKKIMSYYGAHAIIDVGHAEGWLAHVLRPQVAELPTARVGIAEGLVLRADASLDYFDHALAGMRAL